MVTMDSFTCRGLVSECRLGEVKTDLYFYVTVFLKDDTVGSITVESRSGKKENVKKTTEQKEA